MRGKTWRTLDGGWVFLFVIFRAGYCFEDSLLYDVRL